MSNSSFSRRDWIRVTALAAGVVIARTARATGAAPTPIAIYKSPSCGCCAKWVDHLKAAGFATTVHDVDPVDPIKAKYAVPKALQSCHTALVGAYVVEGHVPAADILRLLREKPAVRGLAVPGMPAGSPGMEMGGAVDRYDVVAFARDGKTSVFARH